MRSGGAKIADVAVLVIAADDESCRKRLNSGPYQKRKYSLVVAVNKIDAPGANIDRIKAQLAEHECLVEGYGGSVPMVSISLNKNQFERVIGDDSSGL